MKKYDLFLILIPLLAASVIFFFSRKSSGDTAVIYVDDELYAEIPLSQDKEIDIFGKNTVSVKDGEVFMKTAACPDKICVSHPPIKNSGSDIVCLPNKVVVKIKESGKKSADAISR